MKVKNLNPNQIIALNDYPLRNEHILKLYFRMFSKRKQDIAPPCPVIHRSLVRVTSKGNPHKIKEYHRIFHEFIKTHRKAEYFLLDGTHKTTAATLCHRPIQVIIFQSDKDIKVAKQMVEKGELISLTTGNSLSEISEILKKHFFKHITFQTVKEKTNKMVKGKALPVYMIVKYKRKP